MTTGVGVQEALDRLDMEKSAILPPYLTDAELADLLAAWHRLHDDPEVPIVNARFIVHPKLYREGAFARLATHPVVQEAARRTIGDFLLVGVSVVATPPNGTAPTPVDAVPYHIDHVVYSTVPVAESRDTFVCVWVNFEAQDVTNGPFCIAHDTHKFNLGYEFFKERPGLTIHDFQWGLRARFTVGPAGTTAVYSGKTWHAATTNCSSAIRKGLVLNFVPRHPRDTRKRNTFDAAALDASTYAAFAANLGTAGYVVPRIDPWPTPGQSVEVESCA